MSELPVNGVLLRELKGSNNNQDSIVKFIEYNGKKYAVKRPVHSKLFPKTTDGLQQCQQAAELLKRQYELLIQYLPDNVAKSIFTMADLNSVKHDYYGVLTIQEHIEGSPVSEVRQINPSIYDSWNKEIFPALTRMVRESDFNFFITLGSNVLGNARKGKICQFPSKTPNIIITPNSQIKIVDFGFPNFKGQPI